ncbi:MAG: HAMP domain-containing histidine kinase [Oscillospiraceae bacterium]|jgi:signal transduction histidine kinase|nr:HAMP domain-containing histidine kinase [Oscillospiraceae bacterium]
MKRTAGSGGRSLFSIWNYLIFFLLVAGLVTCSFLVFLMTVDIELDIGIRNSARLTFANVLALSLICTIIDGIRRKYAVQRPVKRILSATRQLTHGDLSVRIAPLHSGGRVNEFDAIIADFNKMAEELEGIETLRSDFIANVSHELKTPLAVIQNYSAMLQDPALPEEKRVEHAKTIGAASARLSELVTNILKLNMLENQQIFPEAREYDLGEQLRECLLAFEDAWEGKRLALDIDIDDLTVKADEELLTIVWNNLFSNAIKFTGEGGSISVSLKEESGCAVAKVSDTGCGMTQEVGRHIFEKFYQGDKSHATRGNGLGLALVKRVVDIVGGEISVTSAVGNGSTFTVRLRGA